MSAEAMLRDALAETARHLYERGHNAPGDGNISARLGERELLCTPSGVHKGRLSGKDVVRIRLVGSQYEVVGQGVPSSELRLHVALLQRDPAVAAVVHTHSPYATALTVAGLSLDAPVIPEATLALGSIPTVSYASPTTSAVPERVLAEAGNARAFLLARHGPVAIGTCLEEACMRIEMLEHTAKITLLAASVGPLLPLPEAEVAALRARSGPS